MFFLIFFLKMLVIFSFLFSFFHVCDFFPESCPGGFARLFNLKNILNPVLAFLIFLCFSFFWGFFDLFDVFDHFCFVSANVHLFFDVLMFLFFFHFFFKKKTNTGFQRFQRFQRF